MGTFFAPTRNVDQEHFNGAFDDGDEDGDDFWDQADRDHGADR